MIVPTRSLPRLRHLESCLPRLGLPLMQQVDTGPSIALIPVQMYHQTCMYNSALLYSSAPPLLRGNAQLAQLVDGALQL